LIAVVGLQQAAQAQWLTGYCYRRSITIDNTQVSGTSDLTNFPVLISISNNDLRSIANDGNVEDANGYDIRVTDNTHTALDIQIENYTASSGEYQAWVRIPTLDYNDNTVLYIYYGNSSANTDPSVATVWDANFAAVWHMNEATGNQILDATANNMDEALNGGLPYSYTNTEFTNTSTIAGVVSDARSFNNVGNQAGDDNYIEIPYANGNALDITGTQITIEVWARMYFPAPTDAPFVMKTVIVNEESYMFGTQGSSNAINRRITSSTADTDNRGWRDYQGNPCTNADDGHYRYDDAYTSDADWHYFAMIYDGSDGVGTDPTNLKTLIDGGLQTFSKTGACDPYPYGNMYTNTGDVLLGKRDGNRYFKGAMDEVRISNTARSEGWVITTYNNINDVANFYAIGSEEYPITGGTATATNTQVDVNENTTITLSGHDVSAVIQWQSSSDNSSFSDIAAENAVTLNTGNLTLTTFFRAKTTLNSCDAFSTTAQVTVRAAFNGDHAYRSIISIDYTKVECTSSLTDFPVLINISGDPNLIFANNKVQDANGYDIIFTDASNAQLSHDLEEYDGVNGNLVAWVEVGTLFCNANTVINMYYGDCGYVGGDQSTTDTWSNSYNGVYHLNDDPSASGLQDDRTVNGNDGTSTNFATDTRLAGQIGQAIELDGNNDYVTFGTGPQVSGTGDRTYEGWIYTQTFGANEGIFQGGDGGNNDFSLYLLNNSSENYVLESNTATDDFTLVSATNNWRYVAVTYENSITDAKIYYDGVFHSVVDVSLNTTVFAAEIGRWNGNTSFDGYMDEFRISSVARSSEWIKTQFNNQSDPSSFYSVDAEVSEFLWSGGAGSTDWNDANNWSTCTVPSTTDDVIIPGSLAFYPLMDQNRTANYINIQSGASLDLNGFQLSVTDDFKNDGTFTPGTGSVIFNGTGEQNIKGTGTVAFYDMQVNKASGTVILNKDVSVTNTLTLTSGMIELNANTLTITPTGSISGGSSASFIVTTSSSCLTQQDLGAGARTGNILYPIGTTVSSYTPVIIDNTTGTADDFCVYVCESVYENGGCSGTPITSKVVNKNWGVTPATGTGLEVTLTLQWETADQAGDFVDTDAYISRYSAGFWRPFAGQDISGQTSPFVLTQSSISDFSSFGVGSDDSTLPVELLLFSARQAEKSVQLKWTTSSELNNDYFDVETSTNGEDFLKIGSALGNGTTNIEMNYSYLHQSPKTGINYYRLRQVDYDGQFEYSPTILHYYQIGENANLVQVYPNPVAGVLHLETSKVDQLQLQLILMDMTGKVILKKKIVGSYNTSSMDLSKLHRGQYFLKIVGSDFINFHKIVKN